NLLPDSVAAPFMQKAGVDHGPPGPRPAYGPRYYAAYLRDPDGLVVEVVAGSG
ncbi:MAG: VOC family protein, partial [Actinomycetota bacterium]|nr:VOC family protein [Actinomycetota bacterium]